ncbi:hypothetical protein LZ575_08805 [Antarcticibacterium sp. 1MA-6-2]|uniref:hypothetical protein n=1 Tax=Antarcticibacterium sp. 1MA-6-2 TaxID=2908210 RepID=UPI001F310F5A|nr:hypothetical protein [Antarcticibacterium sp. 1MA-6-2]UJH92561.1 hypothetical protein LZ575_08805 [Antarcticibacterium sp. 1MA-6-2]
MEKRSREELLMQKMMKDAGLEKPSIDFSANVMKAIAVKKAVFEYKPLISRQAWTIIFSIIGIAFFGFYQMNTGYSLISNFSLPDFNSFSVPKIELSQTMTWAIAFVALFLLEIPFLKRLIERQ